MKGLLPAFWAEALKARRSRAIGLSAAGFMMLPLVGGLMMVILKDPVRAREMGLISAKAQLAAGVADWPTFFDLLTQAGEVPLRLVTGEHRGQIELQVLKLLAHVAHGLRRSGRGCDGADRRSAGSSGQRRRIDPRARKCRRLPAG